MRRKATMNAFARGAEFSIVWSRDARRAGVLSACGPMTECVSALLTVAAERGEKRRDGAGGGVRREGDGCFCRAHVKESRENGSLSRFLRVAPDWPS